MSINYSFLEQNSLGKVGEQKVKEFLEAEGYKVVRVPGNQQLKEFYDFHCVKNKKVLKVEVKTDYRVESTGNLFLEDKVGNKPGWIHNYTNDKIIIIWCLIENDLLVILNSESLPRLNYTKYPKRTVSNLHYKATGYLYPLRDLIKYAEVIEFK